MIISRCFLNFWINLPFLHVFLWCKTISLFIANSSSWSDIILALQLLQVVGSNCLVQSYQKELERWSYRSAWLAPPHLLSSRRKDMPLCEIWSKTLMLSFPHDYQYLIVFLQVPKSVSLKNYLPWVSCLFFADDLNKLKKKTKPSQTKPPQQGRLTPQSQNFICISRWIFKIAFPVQGYCGFLQCFSILWLQVC